jgi:hypothetical protein
VHSVGGEEEVDSSAAAAGDETLANATQLALLRAAKGVKLAVLKRDILS